MSTPAEETPTETAARDVAGLPPAPEVFQVEVGLAQNFCELLYCPDTRQAAVVDPAWEVDRLLREAKTLGNGWRPRASPLRTCRAHPLR